tara:strand:- start:535 stop:756 length:222 start_codon:yes stop_codon:yes gene_type:complete
MTWVKAKERLPSIGAEVECRLKHFKSEAIQEHLLVRVDESDCLWRTADDYCEISYSWDVIEWYEATTPGVPAE